MSYPDEKFKQVLESLINPLVESFKSAFESCEKIISRVKSISRESTDEEYPTAKAVYTFGEEIKNKVSETYEKNSNRDTVIDSDSTDENHPSSKAVYEMFGRAVQAAVSQAATITFDNADIAELSTNLFDKNAEGIVVGRYLLNDTGEEVEDETCIISDYIAVENNSTYSTRVNYELFKAQAIYVALYDSDKNYIGYATGELGSITNTYSSELTFTVANEDAAYVRVTIHRDYVDTHMFVAGDIYPEEYIEHGLKLNKDVIIPQLEKIDVVNLKKITPKIENIVVNNGVVAINDNARSAAFKVEADTTYKINVSGTHNYFRLLGIIGDSFAKGTAATFLVSKRSGETTTETDELIITNTFTDEEGNTVNYDIFFVYLGYMCDDFSAEVEVWEGYNSDGVMIGDKQYYSGEKIETLIENSNAKIKTSIENLNADTVNSVKEQFKTIVDATATTAISEKNLLNLDAPIPDVNDLKSGGFLRGYIFNDAGEISKNSATCITDYIPFVNGQKMKFSCSNGTERVSMMGRRIIGYNENKEFVCLLASSQSAVVLTNSDVTCVRIQFNISDVDQQGMVEYYEGNDYGPTSNYEPYLTTVYETKIKPELIPEEVMALPEEILALPDQMIEIETQINETNESLLKLNKARFDYSFNYIAYSAINGIGLSINTAEHYEWCAKKNFTSIKGDVRITSDSKLIMCHDAGFTFNDEGKIITYNSANSTAIRDMTEAECLALQHASTGYYVCSFDEYIRICKKYGKIAYVTIRNEYMDEVVPEMMSTLKKYGMVKQCIINSFTYSSLQAVREADNTIMLSQVLGFGEALTTAAIDRAVALGNMMICGFNFGGSSTVDDVENVIDTSVIDYAIEKDIRVYEGQVHSMEIADKLIEYGITGAQMMIVPSLSGEGG